MVQTRHTLRYLTAASLAAAGVLSIIASGGGGSTFEGSTAAQGLWSGTTDDSRGFSAIILDDGTYWALYTAVNDGNVIAGLIEGTGSSSGNDFTSSNALDFNFEGLGVNPATIDASFAVKTTLDGTATYPTLSDTVTFNTDYDPAFDDTPALVDIAGTYDGNSINAAGEDPATAIITNMGVVTGSSVGGCAFHGTIAPHAAGNVYDVSVTFEGGVCGNGTATVDGVAFYDAPNSTLYAMALNGARDKGFLYIGTKP